MTGTKVGRLPALGLTVGLLCGCASHPPTAIETVRYPQVVGVPRDAVDIVPQARNLASPRDLAGSRRDPSAKAQATLLLYLQREVSQLPVRGLRVVADTERAGATLRCDLRCHTHVTRNASIVALLPLPRNRTATVCVESELYDTRTARLIERREEWGCVRQRGPLSGADRTEPTEEDLREYLIRKTLAGLLAAVEKCSRSGLLPEAEY
ncbi:MAG: hypothetical protein FJ225_05415 [Lentisphaerae bacterium]|nr:hypothetical protein [Lentisphaerota bacterium]